jgi:hypothetical protein
MPHVGELLDKTAELTKTVAAGGGSGGATDLAYTASATGGTVTSSTGTDATIPLSDGTNAGLVSPAQHTKLSGIATGATANSSDATLLDRANHTGTQAASTISDFSTAADARIAAASVNALSDVTVTSPTTGQVLKWNGTAWANAADATGGGGGGGATVGDAVLDFGATPSAEATVTVTGQAGVLSTSTVDAFFQGSSTADNSLTDHRFAAVALKLLVADIVDGVGFTVYATSIAGLATGTFNLKWRYQ